MSHHAIDVVTPNKPTLVFGYATGILDNVNSIYPHYLRLRYPDALPESATNILSTS